MSGSNSSLSNGETDLEMAAIGARAGGCKRKPITVTVNPAAQWSDLNGSTQTNLWVVPIDPPAQLFYFRLAYP